MCFGTSAKAATIPPTAPVAATVADSSVQQARNDTVNKARSETGLSGTQLTVNLGGQGAGAKTLAGS